MKPIQPLLRGWLAISFIQQLALAFQHLFNPSILYRTLLNQHPTTDLLGGHIFCLICFQQSILKCTLLIRDNSGDQFLHFFHAMNEFIFLIFFMVKLIFGNLILSNGVLILIGFSGISFILTVIYLAQNYYNVQKNDGIPEKSRSRPRKLISSHYLESHISDYSNPMIRKNQ